MVLVGGGRSRHDDADLSPAGDLAVPNGCGVEDRSDHRRGAAHDGDAVLLDPPQYLGAVDLAQHHMGHSHCGHDIGHAPTVAVEHRQRVQVDVAVADPGVPAEGGCVDPQVPMGHLHALGPGSGAAGVVDRRGGRLVGGPGDRLAADPVQRIALGSGDEAVLHRNVSECRFELWVDDQNISPAVLDDVGDFGPAEAEVDGHGDPAEGAGAEEVDEHPRSVVRDHCHPGPEADPEMVETRGQPGGEFLETPVGQLAQRWRCLVRFVDDPDPVAVDERGPAQMISNCERYFHESSSRGQANSQRYSVPVGSEAGQERVAVPQPRKSQGVCMELAPGEPEGLMCGQRVACCD